MAAPTFLGTGTVAAGIAAITPALPTGFTFQTDDLIIGIGECAGGAVFPAASIASNGFAHVNGLSPVTQDTQTTLSVIWRRWTAGLTAHSWGDSGNHNIGRYAAFRGVTTVGNPWNQVASGVESIANNSAEWPAVTTTVAECLVLLILSTGFDPAAASTTNFGLPSGGNLTGIAEHIDNWTETGTGGGVGMASGTLATATTLVTPTATMGTTDTKAYMTLALAPPGAAPTGPPILVMAPPDPT
jgi:hypothetical protein